ncbi:MAG: amino acid-binding domain protein [Nitrospirae bacterium]|nr:amino acid-binding domain protein [Nitrospirota bacterium]
MKVEQISIFLENKSGRLADVASVLAQAGINIRALSLADTTDFGILRLIVNDTEKAKQVLKDNGFTVGKTEVIAVEVLDKPGGLADILNIMKNNGINVEYMYAFVQKSGGNAIIIFRFDELEKAIETLQRGNIRILKGEEVYAL